VLSEPSDAGGGTEAFLYLRRADEICDVGRTTLKEQKVQRARVRLTVVRFRYRQYRRLGLKSAVGDVRLFHGVR